MLMTGIRKYGEQILPLLLEVGNQPLADGFFGLGEFETRGIYVQQALKDSA